jgi:hypothetical protein
MSQSINLVGINYEDDVVTARRQARLVALLLSFTSRTRPGSRPPFRKCEILIAPEQGRPHRLSTQALPRLVLLITISSTRRRRQGSCGAGGTADHSA